jgi:LmbE family N-acetylglucosaminyl deacetylase
MSHGGTSPSCYLHLSPHLDDVALSAGGVVRAQVQSGARVCIASFCTADPPADRALGALARRFHESWTRASGALPDRRAEDREACALLGAEARHLELPDAIYRSGVGHDSAYHSEDELFAAPAAWDGEFAARAREAVRRLVAELAPRAVYGPLGVGAHVDHLQVLRCLEQVCTELGAPLLLYEDQPYTAGIYPRPRGDALDAALRACPLALEAELERIDFSAKAAAIRCYRSQLAELFGADLSGLAALEAYHRSLLPTAEPAERLWRVRLDAERSERSE